MHRLEGKFPGYNYINKEEIKSVSALLKSKELNRYAGFKKKKFCDVLENTFKRLFNKKYALAVNSGTAALQCALFSLDLKKKDEIIIPNFGWSADLMAIISVGATPVIVDIGENLGIDSEKIKKAINRNTKAIINIHMRGLPNILSLKKYLKKKKIVLIEDASQCLGGKIFNKKVGSFGDISTFSFQSSKLITAGEGGIALFDKKENYIKAKSYHDLGLLREPVTKADPIGIGTIHSIGFNFKMSEIHAVILNTQLKKLNIILNNLKKNYYKIKKIFYILEYKKFIKTELLDKNSSSNHAFFVFRVLKNKKYVMNYINKVGFKYVTSTNTYDSHNFNVWKKFLETKKYKFKNHSKNNVYIKNTYYIEVNSK